MNLAKTFFTSSLIVFSFMASACTTLKFGQHISYVGEPPVEQKKTADDVDTSATKDQLKDLRIDTLYVAKDLGLLKDEDNNIKLSPAIKPYPDWLKKDQTMNKIFKQELYYLNRKIKNENFDTQQNFTAKELCALSIRLLKSCGLIYDKEHDDKPGTILYLKSDVKKQSIYENRLAYYLVAYFEGKYVDRSGEKYAKPEVSATIGNDTIIPLLSIVLDAFYDTSSKVPIFYTKFDKSKKEYSNPVVGKNEPTVAAFETFLHNEIGIPQSLKTVVCDYDPDTETYESCDWGEGVTQKYITLNEAKSINLLSGIGAEQSKHIAGLILRMFNDIEFGAIAIGGDISIGDNDTFAKIVDTSVAKLSRAITEKQLYEYMKEKEGEEGEFQEIVGLLGKIYSSLNKKDKEI